MNNPEHELPINYTYDLVDKMGFCPIKAIKVVGSSFDQRQLTLKKASAFSLRHEHAPVHMKVEPDNQFDPNAVAVYVGVKFAASKWFFEQAGYLPKATMIEDVATGASYKANELLNNTELKKSFKYMSYGVRSFTTGHLKTNYGLSVAMTLDTSGKNLKPSRYLCMIGSEKPNAKYFTNTYHKGEHYIAVHSAMVGETFLLSRREQEGFIVTDQQLEKDFIRQEDNPQLFQFVQKVYNAQPV